MTTNQKGIKRLSVILVVAMLLSLIPATLGFAAEVDTAKVEAFVSRLYVAALDRQPDAGGLKFWTNQLGSHTQTAAQAISFILIESKEFKAKNLSDSAFLDTVYKAFFNRAADASGKEFWTKKLTAGYSRRWVIQQMVGAMSGEFQKICAAAGIVPGKVGGVTDADLPYEVVSIAAIDKDQIEVKLNKAASADTVAVLKSGLVPYTTTNTWASDYKSVVLKNSYALPAGDYTVEVKGVSATVKVEAEKASSLSIKSMGLQKTDSTAVEVELTNQYGKKMTVSDSVTLTAFNATKGTKVDVVGLNLDLSEANVNDNVVVTAVHTTGLTVSKTLPVISAFTAGTFKLETVVLPKDQTRVLKDGEYELKYTLLNQYGQAIKLLPANKSSIMFASTDESIIKAGDITVDSDGVLKFKALKEGTVTLTAVVVATGSVSTLTIKVDGPVAPKTFTIAAPASLVVADETVVIPYVAIDQFGAQIAPKDLALEIKNDSTGLSFGTSNSAVIDVKNIKFNYKKQLELTASAKGTATIYVYLKGVLQNSVTITAVEAAVPTRITGLKDFPTMFEVGTSKAIEAANIKVVDQYNRAIDVELEDISIVAKDKSADAVEFDSATFTFSANKDDKAGTEVFTFALLDADDKVITSSALDITMGTVETKNITSYTLSEAGTIYLGQEKQLTLTGKTSTGAVVELKDDKVSYTTSTNSGIATLDKDTLKVKANADDKGEAIVAVWSGSAKLAEVKVIVSDVKPVPTTVSFDSSFKFEQLESTFDMRTKLTVKDQYGVKITITTQGYWTTSDDGVATVLNGVLTVKKAGEVTIGYVTENGILVTQLIETK